MLGGRLLAAVVAAVVAVAAAAPAVVVVAAAAAVVVVVVVAAAIVVAVAVAVAAAAMMGCLLDVNRKFDPAHLTFSETYQYLELASNSVRHRRFQEGWIWTVEKVCSLPQTHAIPARPRHGLKRHSSSLNQRNANTINITDNMTAI